MYTIEFEAKIIDGRIEIPEQYRKKVGHNVKVVLLAEDTMGSAFDMIDELLENPLKLSNFKPFKREEIYD